MHNGKLLTIVGAVFGVAGVILLCVCAALTASTMSFLASAERTDGTVIELTERVTRTRTSDGFRSTSTTYVPTVEYTVHGHTYRFESSTGSNPPAWAEGDTVTVAYDPQNQSDAEIDSFWWSYLGPVVTGVLGVVFTPLGVLLWRRSRGR